MKLIRDHKYFGIGPKNFREVCKQKQYQSSTPYDLSVTGCDTSPLNLYLQILTETGLFGFIFVILIFLYLCFILSKSFIVKIFKKTTYIYDYQICIYVLIFANLWPIMPTGNIFNSYISLNNKGCA